MRQPLCGISEKTRSNPGGEVDFNILLWENFRFCESETGDGSYLRKFSKNGQSLI